MSFISPLIYYILIAGLAEIPLIVGKFSETLAVPLLARYPLVLVALVAVVIGLMQHRRGRSIAQPPEKKASPEFYLPILIIELVVALYFGSGLLMLLLLWGRGL